MTKLKFSPLFSKKLAKLKRRNPKLANLVKAKLKLYQAYPTHSSLRLHKLSGNLQNAWSLSVTKDFRLLFTFRPEPYFFDLSTHAEIYK